LLATPAAVRFISYEPALGAVDFRQWLHDSDCWDLTVADEAVGGFRYDDTDGPCICNEPREDHISWLICGGESGPGARPFDLAWARSVVSQCRAAGVAVFVKQLGAKAVTLNFGKSVDGQLVAGPFPMKDRKGGAIDEWPEDLKVREWPR
jgi:protein gp37